MNDRIITQTTRNWDNEWEHYGAKAYGQKKSKQYMSFVHRMAEKLCVDLKQEMTEKPLLWKEGV